jgi:hypothetical protein
MIPFGPRAPDFRVNAVVSAEFKSVAQSPKRRESGRLLPAFPFQPQVGTLP